MNGSMRHVAILFLAFAITALAADETNTVTALIGDRTPTALVRLIGSETPPNLRFEGATYVDAYEVIGDPIPLPPEAAATLKNLIAEPAAFALGIHAYCVFRPGIGIRCGTGADAIDLIVCFACDEAALVPAGGKTSPTYEVPQETRATILGLAKNLLPADEAIQNLPTVRREKAAPPPVAPGPNGAE